MGRGSDEEDLVKKPKGNTSLLRRRVNSKTPSPKVSKEESASTAPRQPKDVKESPLTEQKEDKLETPVESNQKVLEDFLEQFSFIFDEDLLNQEVSSASYLGAEAKHDRQKSILWMHQKEDDGSQKIIGGDGDQEHYETPSRYTIEKDENGVEYCLKEWLNDDRASRLPHLGPAKFPLPGDSSPTARAEWWLHGNLIGWYDPSTGVYVDARSGEKLADDPPEENSPWPIKNRVLDMMPYASNRSEEVVLAAFLEKDNLSIKDIWYTLYFASDRSLQVGDMDKMLEVFEEKGLIKRNYQTTVLGRRRDLDTYSLGEGREKKMYWGVTREEDARREADYWEAAAEDLDW